MKWHLEDKAIGELFKQLRKEEERAVPSFQEVLRGNEAPGRLEFFAYLRQAAAVAMVLVFSVTLLLQLSQAPELNSALPLSEWQSPTDFLLLSSQEELMSTLPVLELPDFATGQIELR
jgi:hypothetical protein